jgi:hypothetical protein
MHGLALAFGLTACSGGGATTINPETFPSVTNVTRVPVTFRIHVPKARPSSSKARSPQYISTVLASIDFRLTGVSPTGGGTYAGSLNTDTLVPLTYANAACTVDGDGDKTCTATSMAPAPATDTWTISTYATATPTVGTTTPLSVYSAYAQATTVAGPNNLSVATWGVPASLAFSPATAVAIPLVSATFTTSVQVKDAGGATLIGGDNFSSAASVAGSVQMTGCDTHLTPSPATIIAATPTLLGAGNISVSYDKLGTARTTLHCNATAPGGLSAQYAVTVTSPSITEYTVPTFSSQPAGITPGPDGNLWFTEYTGENVAKITTTGAVALSRNSPFQRRADHMESPRVPMATSGTANGTPARSGQ